MKANEPLCPAWMRYWQKTGAITLAVLALAGCASDPRSSKGIDWVVETEAEKARLDAAGFPQYIGTGG